MNVWFDGVWLRQNKKAVKRVVVVDDDGVCLAD